MGAIPLDDTDAIGESGRSITLDGNSDVDQAPSSPGTPHSRIRRRYAREMSDFGSSKSGTWSDLEQTSNCPRLISCVGDD